MKQTIQKCRAVAVGLALLMAAGLSGSALAQLGKAPDEPQARSRAETGATKPCVECHEGFYAITKTKHGVKGDARTPAATGKSITGDPADAMCGACHGDLTEHNKKPRTPGLVPVTLARKPPPNRRTRPAWPAMKPVRAFTGRAASTSRRSRPAPVATACTLPRIR